MRAYPRYKSSGIEWLGEIPAHWEIQRLKYLAEIFFSNVDKKTYDSERDILLCNYLDVYRNDFITKNMEFMKGTATEDEIKRFTLKQGDVLLTKDSETPDDIAKPAFVREVLSGIVCGYHLAIARPDERSIQGAFLFRIFGSQSLNSHFFIAARGITRFGLSTQSFKDFLVPVPPLPEQRAIATWLDRKTALIDTYITKKQQQLERLGAYRAALINQAVTKGLNPDAPMKSSGIEWLGDIPAHWKIQRLKYLVRGKLQYGANEAPESEDIRLPRYIRITDFGENGKLKEETFKSLSYEKARGYLLTEGDILFARSGATVGKTFQFTNYTGMACFAGYLIKAVPDNHKIISDFLYAFTKTKAYENWKNGIFIQATIQNIGADKYNSLPIPLPPLTEQRAIAAYLDAQTDRLDRLMRATRQQLDRLRAYRTALISDAVTGRFDLRDAAPRPATP